MQVYYVIGVLESHTDGQDEIVETVGYVGRALSASQNPGPYTLDPYIMQTLLLLVAPALFAASIYMELGRIVRMSEGEKALFIRRTWLTKIFVCGDVLSFLAQSGGGGLMASGNSSSINVGSDVVVGGLVSSQTGIPTLGSD